MSAPDPGFLGPVRYRLKAYLWVLLLLAFVFTVAGGFILSGVRAQKPWDRWFAIGIGVAFLVAVFASPVGGFFWRAFKPAFIMRTEGFETPRGIVIPWDHVKDAVMFDHGGEEHVGLRLEEGVTEIGGVPLEKLFERDVDWDVYHMPFVTMTGVLRASPERLAEIFRQYGVPMSPKGTFDPGPVEIAPMSLFRRRRR